MMRYCWLTIGIPASVRSTRVGFHRTLQERWLALLWDNLKREQILAVELRRMLLERDEACSSRRRLQEHNTDWNDPSHPSFNEVNAVTDR